MSRHVLIVDRDAARRAALRWALDLPAAEVAELDDPSRLAIRAAEGGAEIALLDLDQGGAALDALRCLRAGPGGQALPVIALVPPGRPDLRLAALLAGAEEATDRDTAPRILQARIRSLLRDRDSALENASDTAFPIDEPPARPGPTRAPASSGLAEAPVAFLAAPSREVAVPRLRLGILTPDDRPGSSLLDDLGRLLDAEVVPVRSARGVAAQVPDLLVIDALATAGDLDQGTRVLALLAELRDRPSTRDAATLVLLPSCAVQTAALALDLGAGDIAAAPVGTEEIALRARALLARKAQADRQRDQLRSQLRAAVTDSLTGLHNHHHADATLRGMAATARKDGGSLAVLMLDIDHFKSINDRYGHATGNRVLIEVGRRLKAGLRPGDLLARIGGKSSSPPSPAPPSPRHASSPSAFATPWQTGPSSSTSAAPRRRSASRPKASLASTQAAPGTGRRRGRSGSGSPFPSASPPPRPRISRRASPRTTSSTAPTRHSTRPRPPAAMPWPPPRPGAKPPPKSTTLQARRLHCPRQRDEGAT